VGKREHGPDLLSVPQGRYGYSDNNADGGKNMKSTFYPITIAGLMVLLLFPCSPAYSQDPGVYAVFEAQMQAGMGVVNAWIVKSNILMSMTILVGVLGAALVAMQKLEGKRYKNAAIAVGFVITALTVVVNTVFPVDYRTLRQNALKAKHIIMKAQQQLVVLHTEENPDNQRFLVQQIAELMGQVNELEEKTEIARNFPQIIAAAHAGDEQPELKPSWVLTPPKEDAISYFFVGMGENPLLATARSESHNDAIEKAVLQFTQGGQQSMAQQVKTDAGSAREYVRQMSSVQNTYLEYDSAAKRYRIFTLLQLNKAFATTVVAKTMRPSMRLQVTEKIRLKQFQQAVLGGEFKNKATVYVGDVETNKAFRLIIYEAKENAPVLDAAVLQSSKHVRSVAKTIIFDGKVHAAKKDIEFQYANRRYVLVFSTKEVTGPDIFDFVVYRI
jgi:hypothetical protein